MTRDKDIQALEQSIQQANVLIELGMAMDRLRANRDFKKVIAEGYFEKEAIRLVHLKANVAMQDSAAQNFILSQMDAIGILNQYFQTLDNRAHLALKSLESDESTLSEILEMGVA